MTLTRGQEFEQKAKGKHCHCSAISNTAWDDLNSTGDPLKLHDKCPNNNCKCQKQNTF